MSLLVGDIGGTKADLGFIEGNVFVKETRVFCRDFSDPYQILDQFIDRKLEGGCLAVAGIVEEDGRRCHLTNLPWVIDADELERRYRIPCLELLNDVEAMGWVVDTVQPQEVLNRGHFTKGNRAVVSVGTGLGVAALYWNGKRHFPFSTEAGHVDFAPRNQFEEELLRYLLEEDKAHVSYEMILSTAGLERVHRFVKWKKPVLDTLAIEEKTGELFVSIYASFLGNVALQYLCRGGIYLGGGLFPKWKERLKESFFIQAFTNKGRFSSFLSGVPIYLVLDERAPIKGAAHFAFARKYGNPKV